VHDDTTASKIANFVIDILHKNPILTSLGILLGLAFKDVFNTFSSYSIQYRYAMLICVFLCYAFALIVGVFRVRTASKNSVGDDMLKEIENIQNNKKLLSWEKEVEWKYIMGHYTTELAVSHSKLSED
jgi:divalent metal cation (Fe/Co/Zn/Cd) transporter